MKIIQVFGGQAGCLATLSWSDDKAQEAQEAYEQFRADLGKRARVFDTTLARVRDGYGTEFCAFMYCISHVSYFDASKLQESATRLHQEYERTKLLCEGKGNLGFNS